MDSVASSARSSRIAVAPTCASTPPISVCAAAMFRVSVARAQAAVWPSNRTAHVWSMPRSAPRKRKRKRWQVALSAVGEVVMRAQQFTVTNSTICGSKLMRAAFFDNLAAS